MSVAHPPRGGPAPHEISSTSIVWTSDHGQSLRENGQTYTHCKSEIEQAIVPFVIISGHPWVRQNELPEEKRRTFVYSHHHLYPTLISLFSKNRDTANGPYDSVFATSFRQPRLAYVYGPLWAASDVRPVTEASLTPFRGRSAVRRGPTVGERGERPRSD